LTARTILSCVDDGPFVPEATLPKIPNVAINRLIARLCFIVSFPSYASRNWRREEIACLINSQALRRHYALSEIKLHLKRASDELGEEGATEERSAYPRQIVRAKETREPGDERIDSVRVGKQRVEV